MSLMTKALPKQGNYLLVWYKNVINKVLLFKNRQIELNFYFTENLQGSNADCRSVGTFFGQRKRSATGHDGSPAFDQRGQFQQKFKCRIPASETKFDP